LTPASPSCVLSTYDFPEAPEAIQRKNEYLFGENMLVAPVVHPVSAETGLQVDSAVNPYSIQPAPFECDVTDVALVTGPTVVHPPSFQTIASRPGRASAKG